MTKTWKNYRQQRADEADDDSTALINHAIREDYVFEARDRAKIGKPRLVALEGLDQPFVRLAKVNAIEHGQRRIADGRKDQLAVSALIDQLSTFKTLGGPSTIHGVDEMVATLFDEAANFGPALEAIRRSAQVNIRRRARWLQFRPLVIQSDPGAGKTRIVSRLAEVSGLPLIYLDCASMTNMTPIISQDGSWSGARHSDIMDGLARSEMANVIVCLDELDKVRDYSRHNASKPSEALVGLLEKRSAQQHMDNFLQLEVDLSFTNWVILVNNLDRLSHALLDRCQVIRLPPPTSDEIVAIAAREIDRRGLEPDLVRPIAVAVQDGQITSMRKLHRLLDRAAAASARPRLN